MPRRLLAQALTRLLKSHVELSYSDFFVNLRKTADKEPNMFSLAKPELQEVVLRIVQQSSGECGAFILETGAVQESIEEFTACYHRGMCGLL